MHPFTHQPPQSPSVAMTAWPLLLALGVNPLWLVWDCGDTIKCLSCHPFLKPPEGDSVLSSVPLSSLHLKCSLNPWRQSDPPNQAWIILSLGAWLSVLLCHIQNVAPYGVFAYEHVALPTGGTVLWDEIGEMQREIFFLFSSLWYPLMKLQFLLKWQTAVPLSEGS